MQESKLARQQFTDEFKIKAIRLAESIAGHEAARRRDLPVATAGSFKTRRAAAGFAEVAAPKVVSSSAATHTR